MKSSSSLTRAFLCDCPLDGYKICYNGCMSELEFIDLLSKHDIKLNTKQLEQFKIYAQFLKEYNEKINLTAITELEEVYEKHFYDSLLLSFNKKMEGTLVDVGTGAGFPGVVIKIAFPDMHIILVEPLKKRCIFLSELIDKLGLENIDVINDRGEDYALMHREQYDFVTARAVTNLSALIEICGAMVKVDGYFIALRGLNGLSELEASKNAYQKMGFKLEKINEYHLSDSSLRVIADLKKLKSTPVKFPRNYSMIKRKPL